MQFTDRELHVILKALNQRLKLQEVDVAHYTMVTAIAAAYDKFAEDGNDITGVASMMLGDVTRLLNETKALIAKIEG